MAEQADKKRRRSKPVATTGDPPVTKDTPVTEAVKKLRLALGDTQQQFAQRLGMAISTVVRYETTRAPGFKVLLVLRQVAIANGFHALGAFFYGAAWLETGGRFADYMSTELELKRLWKAQLMLLKLALMNDQEKPEDRLNYAVNKISEFLKDLEKLVGPTPKEGETE